MNKSAKRLIMFSILALPTFLVAYFFRWELGLVKPKYKKGDCIRETYEGSTYRSTYDFKVDRVLKEQYIVSMLSRTGEPLGSSDYKGIRRTDEDEDIIKIDCSDVVGHKSEEL